MTTDRDITEAEATRIAEVIREAWSASALSWADYCKLVQAAAKALETQFGPIKLEGTQQ